MKDWQKVIHSIHVDEDAFIGDLKRKGLLVLITTMTEVVRNEWAFNMDNWNFSKFDDGIETFEEQHKCGMAACLGGWVALHPTFKEMGGKAGRAGEPILNGEEGEAAINELLGLRRHHVLGWYLTRPYSRLYIDLQDENEIGSDIKVTASDVLVRLAYLLKINDAAQQAA